MSKQTQNKKAGLYYRLSQEDERAGESLSIENQKKILEKYARENGFEIIDEYIDDGWSGTNFNRPGVQRLLEDAKNGRINVIIVKDLSRFGRNYIEVGQYTDYLFPTYNIRFIAVGDNVDSAVTENTGMDMTPIMNVFNEWHAANTSKKIRAVIEANAREGIYRSNQALTAISRATTINGFPSLTAKQRLMCGECLKCGRPASAPTILHRPTTMRASFRRETIRSRSSVFRTHASLTIYGQVPQ